MSHTHETHVGFSAETILQQLGGNKFIAMTGAKNFWSDSNYNKMGFQIGRNSKSISHVAITLNSKDLYNIEFVRIRKNQVKIVSKVVDIYADQLQDVFTENTGLDTHL
jgi:NAD/NADP transhydrogenase alpha subunit